MAVSMLRRWVPLTIFYSGEQHAMPQMLVLPDAHIGWCTKIHYSGRCRCANVLFFDRQARSGCMSLRKCLAVPAPASSAGHYVSRLPCPGCQQFLLLRLRSLPALVSRSRSCKQCKVVLMVKWSHPADGTGREFMRTIDHEFTVDPDESGDGEVGCLCCSQRRRCPECLAELSLQRCPAVRCCKADPC
jgi:hypothetical protein